MTPLSPPNEAHVAKITACVAANNQIQGSKTTPIYDSLPSTISTASGKVRDAFTTNDATSPLVLVTTDRQSAFDRHLTSIPYKGAVLNLISAYWFDQTKDILPNHIISTPHPNITCAKKAEPFPIEFVVRAYLTGSTETSIWKHYSSGARSYCGHPLPDGLLKNTKLANGPIMTPTTKGVKDRPISYEEILSEGLMSKADLDICQNGAIEIFKRGQKLAADRGFILVDTKFEMGRDPKTNEIIVIDEMLTPDSSRYWIQGSYDERMAAGKEPENIDKEFLRLWYKENCDPYDLEAVLPEAPKELVVELSRRYIYLFEAITGKPFVFDDRGDDKIIETIKTLL